MDLLPQCFTDYKFVGSRSICNPPPMDTDIDFLCMSNPSKSDLKMGILLSISEENHLMRDKWINDISFVGNNPYKGHPLGDKFLSYRRFHYNLIVTPYREFHKLFWKANCIAKERNLLKKEDRKALFDEVMAPLME